MKLKLLISFFLLAFSARGLAQGGEYDQSFSVGAGFNGAVNGMLIQSSGKIVAGGAFTSYNGTAVGSVVRLNTDGTLDESFTLDASFPAPVIAMALQGDGKIVVVGGSPATFYWIKRLNSDGTNDDTFSMPGAGVNGVIWAVGIQSTGKIIIAGNFNSYNSVARSRVARLNSDGSLDDTFIPTAVFNNAIYSLDIASDDKILVGGIFTSTKQYMDVLNADGTTNVDFGGHPFIEGYAVKFLGDGKMLVGGVWSGTGTGYLRRVNTNGTHDATFNQTSFNNSVLSLAIQPDGKVLVGGDFTNGIQRLTVNGISDPFLTGTGFNGTPGVKSILVQSDGKVLVGGGLFTSYNGFPSSRIARLLSCSSTTEITQQPQALSLCVGGDGEFSVIAPGEGLTYQWQMSSDGGVTFTNLLDGGIFTGTTTSTLALTSVTSDLHFRHFRCIVGDGSCVKTSDKASLSVLYQEISANPVNAETCEGINAAFTVVVAGSFGNYQWQVDAGGEYVDLENNAMYSGVNTSTLTIVQPLYALNGYNYRLVASRCIPVYSEPATLTVKPMPVITLNPISSQGLCESGDAIISIETEGGPYIYQWFRGSTSLSDNETYSGVNTPTLQITGATSALNNSAFRCYVQNETTGCYTQSTYSLFYVYSTPVVGTHPVDVEKCLGTSGDVVFSVALSNPQVGVTYQWQVDSGNGYENIANSSLYNGANHYNLVLSFASLTTELSGNLYRCLVGACDPPVASFEALLILHSQPQILQQPQLQTTCAGSEVTFSVEAPGSNIGYQWQSYVGGTYTNLTNNDIYFGVNSNTLIINGADVALDNYYYRCVIESGTCTVNSGLARLIVRSYPQISVHPSDVTVNAGSNAVFTVTATGTSLSYQWQANGVNLENGTHVSGAQGPTLVLLSSGNAAYNGAQIRCIVTSLSTCSTPSNEALLTINGTSVETNELFSQVSVYPVPNNGRFTVENGSSTSVVVYVENALGQKIMEFPLGLNTSREVNQQLSSGMFLVRITAANGQVAVKRIIVN
jgi:uncharacterized delta-60 repeat protein